MSSWIDETKETMAVIKNLSPKDRLSYYAGVLRCCMALRKSIEGWLQWLRNPLIMDNFSDEDLKQLFEKFQQHTLDLLDMDVYYTEKFGTSPKRPRGGMEPV